MNAQNHIDGQANLDQLLEQLAHDDADSEAQADSTLQQLRAGLEMLAGELRQAPQDDPFLHETALRRGLEFVKANGIQPPPTPPLAALDGSQNDLGSVREYRLLAKLGQGGMGTVYKALHTRLDRVVALKVLPADRMQAETIERFQREMKAVGKLSHPNIVAAHDAGEVDGRHYLVMELVDGIDLSQLARRSGPLKIAEGCELVRQAAVGLQHAHERGLVHRDIKPSNLMLAGEQPGTRSPQRAGERSAKATVKILDLGLALLDGQPTAERRELTTTGQAMGTLGYMAPEQATDSHLVDIRADIYSLGATLYKLLCGEPPFPASKYNTPVKLLTALATLAAPSIASQRDDLPPELVAIVDRMLARRPDDRFATPAEVAKALEPFAAGADLAALLDKAAAEETEGVVDHSTLPTHESLKSGSVETAPTIDLVPETQGEERAPATSGSSIERGPQGKPRTGFGAGRRNPTIAVAAALGGVLLILLAAVVYRIQTDQGTLIVAIEDPAVQAILEKDGLVIHDKHSDRTWTIKAAQTKPLPSGEYQLQANPQLLVTDDSGMELTTDTFTLKRKGEVRVRVTLQQAARVAAKELAPSNTIDPDRRAAEWVLSIGGRIQIKEKDQDLPSAAASDLPLDPVDLARLLNRYGEASPSLADLPREPFKLTLANLEGIQKVTDVGLASFQDCKNLTSLWLDKAPVSDAGLIYFKDCKNLELLGLGHTKVSDAGLAHFQDFKNLAVLGLQQSQVSDAGLAHFKNCKNLVHLDLYGAWVSDAGLAHFKDCKNLVYLDLHETQVSDAGLAHLKDCKNLARLDLGRTHVTDAGLAHFKDCKNLVHLDLYGTRMSNAGLAHFKDCKFLTHLDLYETQVGDAGMAHLKDCKNLARLNVGRTHVTDAVLAHFKDCEKLTSIQLDGTRVSDAGLGDLASLPAINDLFLEGTRISLYGYEQLKAALPKCKITWHETNRFVAESVLAVGGRVEIGTPGQPESRPIQPSADLPGDFFQVRRISLAGGTMPQGEFQFRLSWLRFPEFDRLESLDLSGITGLDYSFLAPIHSLRELSLAKAGLNGSTLSNLPKLPALERLVLDENTLGGPGLTALEKQIALTELSLANAGLIDQSLAQLPKLPALKRLVLDGNAIRGGGLVYLRDRPKLIELSLGCPMLNDLTAKNLAELQQVKRLSLAGSGLSDRGIKHLAGLTNLESLDLRGAKVTAEGVAELQQALPNCQIVWDDGNEVP